MYLRTYVCQINERFSMLKIILADACLEYVGSSHYTSKFPDITGLLPIRSSQVSMLSARAPVHLLPHKPISTGRNLSAQMEA